MRRNNTMGYDQLRRDSSDLTCHQVPGNEAPEASESQQPLTRGQQFVTLGTGPNGAAHLEYE